MTRTRTLERRALRLEQPGGNVLYCFSIAPSEVLMVADIARVARSQFGELIGYQRPAVRTHIDDIRTQRVDGERRECRCQSSREHHARSRALFSVKRVREQTPVERATGPAERSLDPGVVDDCVSTRDQGV
jgi:hypothetical protein